MTEAEAWHSPCGTCGRCCHSYIVPVAGEDVWRISTAQRLSPAAFLVACPQKEPDVEGFRLAPEGPTYFLALDKQGRFGRHRPCVFLVRLAGGHERCGIYDHRPVVCHAYPMEPRDGGIRLRDNALCPPDSWPAAVVQRPSWRLAYKRQRMMFDIYSIVVARWNARVAAAPPDATFRMHEYSSFLLNVYDRLDAMRRQVGTALFAEVEEGWGSLPAPPDDGTVIRLRGDEAPWLAYLLRVRAVVDGFYPAIPPQPVLPWLLRGALAEGDEAGTGTTNRHE